MTPTTLMTLTRTTPVTDHPRPYIYHTIFELETDNAMQDADVLAAIVTVFEKLGVKHRMIPSE